MNFFKAFAFVLALTPVVGNAADTFSIDSSHANIVWKVDHLGFSSPNGTFSDVTGTFVLDEANPENSSVEVIINPANILTNVPKFTDHLKSADFFDVEKHTTITFKSTKVEKTGENTANITGDLTLLGVTKPITLAATLNKIGENPFSKAPTAGFSLTGSVKRSEFGMGYGLPLIGDDVALSIEVEGIKQ